MRVGGSRGCRSDRVGVMPRGQKLWRGLMVSVSFAALGVGAPAQGQEWQKRFEEIEQGAGDRMELGGVQLVQASPSTQAEVQSFDIPAQALPVALRAFARQTSISVLNAGNTASGLSTSGVKGDYTPEQALQLLLTGSGVTYHFQDANSVTLERGIAQQQGGPVVLDTINVEGEIESPVGPDEGYVASRSYAGTKTSTSLIETPQSISVVTRDQMDARAVQDIGEAVQYTAGVHSNVRGESTGLGGSNIVIRGFGGDGTAGASDNEYIDGLRVAGTNFASAGFEPYLFERIEVLKGPSSVLYGQGTPGGVVNHVSKRPTKEAFHEIQGQVGSFDRFAGAFDLSGPIDEEGQFLYRVTGLALDSEAQTDFTSRERKVIAPALTWQPSNDTALTLLSTYQQDDFEGGFINRTPAFGTIFANPNGEVPENFYSGDPNFNDWDRTYYSLGYQFEHRFNETWTVRQNSRYLHNDLEFESIFGNLQADLRTLNRTAFGAEESSDDVTIDNQVEVNFSTGAVGHTVLGGLDYQNLRNDTLRTSGVAPALDIFNPVYYQVIPTPGVYQEIEVTQQQVGIYAQDQIRYENWILTLGGRYDWAETETENKIASVTTERSDRAFSGRAGLGYVFDNGIAPYVSYSESFEPVAGTDFSGAAFKPKEATQYEAGVKYQPTGYNSTITVAAFQLTEQNRETTDLANSGFSIQKGEIRSRGIEVEGVASLGNGLSLIAAYTHLDLEITESDDGDVGNTLTGVAENWASLWGDYRIDEGDFAGLGLGLGIRYVGSSYGDAENTFKVPSYALLDAAVHYDFAGLGSELEGWQLAVNAKNLLDKNFIASCERLDRCFQGVGRNVLATLKFRW